MEPWTEIPSKSIPSKKPAVNSLFNAQTRGLAVALGLDIIPPYSSACAFHRAESKDSLQLVARTPFVETAWLLRSPVICHSLGSLRPFWRRESLVSIFPAMIGSPRQSYRQNRRTR